MNPIYRFLGGKKFLMVDFEANGLLDDSDKGHAATKIWVMGWWEPSFGGDVKTTTDYQEMKKIIDSVDYVFCHNGILYDDLLCQKILGFSFVDKIIDTLGLSWYLHPKRLKHGLEAWGNELGIYKPEVTDWSEQPIEVYINRVVEDVKIQAKLSYKLVKDLLELYGGDAVVAKKLLSFLNDTLDIYQDLYKNPFTLDVETTTNNLEELTKISDEKVSLLKGIMPPAPIFTKKSIPKVLYKKDGSLSHYGIGWYKLLEEIGSPSDVTEVKYITGYGEPNPKGDKQIKDFLFSLDWEPCTFKDVKEVSEFGDVSFRKVPQIKDKEGLLTKSVLKLVDKHPAIQELDTLGVLTHRIGILKGFLATYNKTNNTIFGSANPENSFANTLRVRHKKPLVNLPKPKARFGKHIRECLTAPEGKVIIGIDVVSLENYCRTNSIAHLDPSSIENLLDDSYDTHIALAEFAGLMSKEDVARYKELKALLKEVEHLEFTLSKELQRLDSVRDKAKTTSYSALYGVGAAKLAKELGVLKSYAEKLLKAYWDINWAVVTFANSAAVTEWNGLKWIEHPFTKIKYEFRKDYSKFSSLNQGLGSWIVGRWIKEMRRLGIKITFFMHDECQIIELDNKDAIQNTLDLSQKAMDEVNSELGFIVPIKVDSKVGRNYGLTH